MYRALHYHSVEYVFCSCARAVRCGHWKSDLRDAAAGQRISAAHMRCQVGSQLDVTEAVGISWRLKVTSYNEFTPKHCRVKYEQTLLDVKQAVAHKLGVPVEQQQLFLHRRVRPGRPMPTIFAVSLSDRSHRGTMQFIDRLTRSAADISVHCRRCGQTSRARRCWNLACIQVGADEPL